MPNLENLNTKSSLADKYIDREAYNWTREQDSRKSKEYFFNATILIAAIAVYVTWAWMIIQKLRA